MRHQKSHLIKLLKYGFAGLSAVAVDFCVFVALLWALSSYRATGITEAASLFSPVTIANIIGIISGFLWSFILQKYWAFNSKGNTWNQLIATSLLMGFNMIITSFAIPLIATHINTSIETAKLVMQFTVVSWNYLIYNYFIFKRLGDKE